MGERYVFAAKSPQCTFVLASDNDAFGGGEPKFAALLRILTRYERKRTDENGQDYLC